MESPFGQAAPRRPTRTVTNALETVPPHEMSYETIKRLQYGGSRAQEFTDARPHIRVPMWMTWVKTPRAAAASSVDRALDGNKIASRAARRGGTFCLLRRLGAQHARVPP